MSSRANIDIHLKNMIGGREVPVRGQWGFCPGAIAIKSIGEIGLGLYINRGTKESCDFRGTNGQSPIIDGGAEQLLYELDTTQNYDVGAREALPDGTEFRYCKSTGATTLKPNVGCCHSDTGFLAYTAFGVSAVIGDKEITIPAATHAAVAKDALRGGYVVVFDGSSGDDVTYEIAGNDASLADVAFKVTLTSKIGVTITAATDACEVYSNPWGAIVYGSAVLPFAGVPAKTVTATASYFWCQTKGPKFVSSQSGVGADNGGLVAYWRHDGSLQQGETALGATVPALDTNQIAGSIIAGSQAGNGPLVFLKGV